MKMGDIWEIKADVHKVYKPNRGQIGLFGVTIVSVYVTNQTVHRIGTSVFVKLFPTFKQISEK